MALEGSTDYLAVKIGSASELGWVLLVYLMSNPSEETPGTRKSLDMRDIRSYMPIHYRISTKERLIAKHT